MGRSHRLASVGKSKMKTSTPLPAFFSTSARMKPPSNKNGLPTYIYVVGGVPIVLTGFLYYRYLDEAPLTHRQRWIATTPAWERQLGDDEYQKLLTQFHGQILPKDHSASITVHRVGKRIAEAAQVFATQHGLTYDTSNTTYTVVRSDMANAFVLPNNHVFVMTGLFQYAQNEDELAAVLGHEMAHNLARHVGEKVSGSLVMSLLARLSLLADPSGVLLTIFLPASNLLRDLPHARTQESEADQIGIHLAAQACYDPRAAKRVFQAMKDQESKTGQPPPEFLSTHPSHESRIVQFDQWLPEVMKTFRRDTGECQRLRQEMQEARQMAALQQASRAGPQRGPPPP
jgi:predicted Zn-dependent protease